ncbi:MAG: transglycosylase SLT domain-containing protein [Candidatus Doudnabacteria bacterium]|nr:transglycosylase SLT domain-containing protein [Candidatus Doudnabacteria bacterium]
MHIKTFLTTLLLTLFIPLPVQAQTAPVGGLLEKVTQAKQLLEPIKLNYALTPQYKTVKKKKVLSHYTLTIKDLAVAVYDPATGTILTTSAMQRGSEFEFPDRNFDIKKIRFNGVNTRFQVNKPAGGLVVALKYLITPVESGSKVAIEQAMYPALYTPYAPELTGIETSTAGDAYLTGVIQSAAAALQNKSSVSVPGKTIPEAIKPELVRALLYAEHMDTAEFINTTNTQSLIDKVNVLLATNKGDTWKYSVSSAGAAGISQFIPSTYASLVKRHTDVALVSDFVAGMRDHVNAVKATFILLDDYIKAVQDRAPEYFLSGHAFDYGVAAYNGGPARVALAAKQFGTAWYEDQSAKLAPYDEQIALQAKVVQGLQSQIKKTTAKTQKSKLQATLKTEQAKLDQAKAERAALDKAILRNETVNYVLKIHRLVQVFNANPTNLAAK